MSLKDKIKRFLKGPHSRVKVGKQYVGPGEPVFIIAEVGINHNGDIDLARELILKAKEAGADAVKFQKRSISELLTKEGLEKRYDSPHAFAPTYGEHRLKLEFSKEEYIELKRFAEENNILFFASVWDRGSTDFMEELKIDAYKIPSADVVNIPLLEYVARKSKPVMLSFGMNTEEEIEGAIRSVLRHNDKVLIMNCLSLYPAPEEKINLRFDEVLRAKYHPLPVGYSGHEVDLLPTLAAVSRGAHIVERHFTLDKKMKGSDHAASLEPDEFKELVKSIRRIEKILGEPKRVMHEELKPLREKLAKSVVTARPIKRGEKIKREMLEVKSPGSGIMPYEMHKLIGKKAKIDLDEDAVIPRDALSW